MAADLIDIPDGDIRCLGECGGNPSAYLEDYGVRCPDCLGLGHHPNPDSYDACGAFDPRAEYGSIPRLHGNGRGQL